MFVLDPDVNAQVRQQQARVGDVIAALRPQLAGAFAPSLVSNVAKVYVTGCGDSFFAALGVRLFFERVTGISVEPVEAMEFSRYVVQHIPPRSLLLAVSNSGRVSRTAEAIIQARKAGAHTIALTGYLDRAAAQEAHAAIVAALPNIRATLDALSSRVEAQGQDEVFERLSEPGAVARYADKLGLGSGIDLVLFMLGAYLNSLIILFGAAIEIGLARGHISAAEGEHLHAEILRSVEIIVRTTYANAEHVEALAQRFIRKDSFLYIGAGPAYAAAALSAAKLFEQPHLNGVAQYLEEWAHLQFFFTRPDGIPVFVIAPPGASRDRAMEQISGIKQLGGTAIAICDSEDRGLARLAGDALLIQGSQAEEFAAWTYGVPGQMLAITLLDLRGMPPIPAPYSFKQMMQVNFRQVYGSAIRRD